MGTTALSKAIVNINDKQDVTSDSYEMIYEIIEETLGELSPVKTHNDYDYYDIDTELGIFIGIGMAGDDYDIDANMILLRAEIDFSIRDDDPATAYDYKYSYEYRMYPCVTMFVEQLTEPNISDAVKKLVEKLRENYEEVRKLAKSVWEVKN